MASGNRYGWIFISYLVISNLQFTNARSSKLSRGGSDEFTASKVKNYNGSRGGLIPSNDPDISGANVGEVIAQKSFPISSQEPSCEQLRAMWIFSKRQSRAAEMTNEIPTFRDPFAYNVWEPYYPSTRHIGGTRLVSSFADRNRLPVFGKIVSREPLLTQRINFSQRKPIYNGDGSTSRFYGTEAKTSISNSRRPPQNRYIGGANGSSSLANTGYSPENGPIQGSFQKLKELIWTERAKELTQQRRAEELAAKAAVLKEITNGQNLQPMFKTPTFISDSPLMDENRSPDTDGFQYMDDNVRSKIDNKAQVAHISKNHLSKSSGNVGYGRFNYNRNHKINPNIKDTIDESSIDAPKMYPMRPSHFRERNRVLLKQANPSDLFRRFRKANEKENLLVSNPNNNGILLYKSSNQNPRFKHSFKIDDDDDDAADDDEHIDLNEQFLDKVAQVLFA